MNQQNPLPPVLKNHRIVLASNSPRRKELIRGLGWEVEYRDGPGIRESFPPHLQEGQIAEYLALSKSRALDPGPEPDELIITADTVVWFKQQLLPKPSSPEEAEAMLRMLSGNTHRVITGVCIRNSEQYHTFTSGTRVTFGTLGEEEIQWYVQQYRPYDKAGAYGIQEWIGMIGIEGIEGSYYNVMGLPVQRLYREMKKMKTP